MWLLAARVVSNVSSVITMLVFLVGTRDHPCVVQNGVCGAADPATLAWWRIILAALVTALVATIVIVDLIRTCGARPRSFAPGSSKIQAYLVKWIRSGGNAAIVSRNMSWVDGGVLQLLRERAKSGDLALYLPQSTNAVQDLAKYGATVYEYGGQATKARFTIVNAGRGDARVAIGATVGGKHVIREYGAGDPVLVVAQDLLDRLSRP